MQGALRRLTAGLILLSVMAVQQVLALPGDKPFKIAFILVRCLTMGTITRTTSVAYICKRI